MSETIERKNYKILKVMKKYMKNLVIAKKHIPDK